MISSRTRTLVYVILGFLIILDIILSATCLFFPEQWYKFFHAAPYIDPQGLLRRTGAVWVAFTVLQIIAFFRWEKAPWWLVLIAGVRFTELFSDWTYVYFAESLTTLGKIGLLIAPPKNLIFGWFFVRTFLKLVPESRESFKR